MITFLPRNGWFFCCFLVLYGAIIQKNAIMEGRKQLDWFVKYVLPTLITVLSGVFVYLLGELLNTIWLKPLHDFKGIKSEIAKNLVFYSNVYTNVLGIDEQVGKWKELHTEASDKLRWLAAELEGFIQTLSWLKIGIPKKADLSSAVANLILLSNCMFDQEPQEQNKENREIEKKIRCLLKIYRYKKLKNR